MKVAIGLKSHSGWAALVALGVERGKLEVVDRRRIDMVKEDWAKQPYHAAEELGSSEARKVVERGIREAYQGAERELVAAVKRLEMLGNKVRACGVLMGDPMPKWSVEEILAVHFRMHKAEGVLFREALAQGARHCGIKLVEIPEKTLADYAAKALKTTEKELTSRISALGKVAGPPWGKDQKEAALAAMLCLR